MATPAQIAARKKFAERARSGELAKMRKKSTRKSNPMVISKQADSSLSKYGSRGYLRKMLDDYSDLGHVVAVRKKRTGGVSISLDGGRAMTPEQARKKLEDFFGYANNPTATRAPARKRTQLVSNGERKKNPMVKTFPAYGEFRFKVETSADGINFRDPVGFPKKLDAIKYAKMLAKLEPRLFIRVYELTAADLSYAV